MFRTGRRIFEYSASAFILLLLCGKFFSVNLEWREFSLALCIFSTFSHCESRFVFPNRPYNRYKVWSLQRRTYIKNLSMIRPQRMLIFSVYSWCSSKTVISGNTLRPPGSQDPSLIRWGRYCFLAFFWIDELRVSLRVGAFLPRLKNIREAVEVYVR